MTTKARLDTDRTAEPRTRLLSRAPGGCFQDGLATHYEGEDGTRVALTEHTKRNGPSAHASEPLSSRKRAPRRGETGVSDGPGVASDGDDSDGGASGRATETCKWCAQTHTQGQTHAQTCQVGIRYSAQASPLEREESTLGEGFSGSEAAHGEVAPDA